ncbi:MAG: DNA adenine methylase [Kiritimatiellae bacterium]|nr:DNA adenine methylase [Kiritimatiellia bacterium]
MRHDSPLRYPGGKASLSAFLTRTIELNNLTGCSYFEPFAGGAGAALRLLRDGIVTELHLNDADPRIAAFWRAVLEEPERFVDSIMSIPLNVSEWRKQHALCQAVDTCRSFDLGFATFYLNRCNRSGVLLGAGPIGGYIQTGKWGIDARFNRENLAERVLTIARKRAQIHITNMDALNFLADKLPRGYNRKRVFAYLDPPYYSNGNRLYLNFYNDREHRHLSRYIQRQTTLKWVMSYDDALFIRKLYAPCRIYHLSLQYSLQRKQKARELLIAPANVRLPSSIKAMGQTSQEAATA